MANTQITGKCTCNRLPLTDEEIKDVAASCMWWVREQDILDDAIELARAIEAAHGIKENT